MPSLKTSPAAAPRCNIIKLPPAHKYVLIGSCRGQCTLLIFLLTKIIGVMVKQRTSNVMSVFCDEEQWPLQLRGLLRVAGASMQAGRQSCRQCLGTSYPLLDDQISQSKDPSKGHGGQGPRQSDTTQQGFILHANCRLQLCKLEGKRQFCLVSERNKDRSESFPAKNIYRGRGKE